MNQGQIGRVITTEEGRFQWIIDDFLSKAFRKENVFQSPPFSFSGESFYFKSSFHRQAGLSLSFRNNSGLTVRKLNVKLGLKTENSGEIEIRSGETDNDGLFSVEAWMSATEMLKRRREILQDGCLTVLCELRRLDVVKDESRQQNHASSEEEVDEQSESEGSEKGYCEYAKLMKVRPLKKMRKDLMSLLDSGEYSDVTIKIQGKEYWAHRNILHVRSPVFKSILSEDKMEKQRGVVAIEDCDPVTFRDFLNYLYTGNTDLLCEGNACQLYIDADKYGVEELKNACAVFMENNMSVDKFCDILALALRYNEIEVIESATEFFCENMPEITKTAKWVTFLHENTEQGNQLIIRATSDQRQNE